MDDAETAARGMLALEVARRAIVVLGREGIEVMPLKGVLMLGLRVPGSATRYVGDVDVLVRRERFDAAVRLLGAAGFHEVARASHAVTLWNDELAFHVDLHHRLFPRGWFRLETAGLFARAVDEERRFGARVRVMDAYDVYAHLVGHFVVGRHNAADRRHVADFGAVAEHFDLDPTRCARRLESGGLARAARYVLREVAVGPHAAHARGVLAALLPDAIGDGLGLLSHGVLARWPRRAGRAAVVARLYAF